MSQRCADVALSSVLSPIVAGWPCPLHSDDWLALSSHTRLPGAHGVAHPPRPAKVCDAILQLTGKPPSDVTVLYMGTATYDHETPRLRQTKLLADAGCKVNALDVAFATPAEDLVAAAVTAADVIVISGGNTSYAMRRWTATGLKPLLRAAMERGVVMSGGSAGAICWFDAGHSDSMDQDTYKETMLATLAGAKDESSDAPAAGQAAKPWEYIRVGCLGFLPGLVCPHHDKTQSNGVLRAVDFDAMMLRHSGERGICIDHWAALVVKGDDYSVLRVSGKGGSLRDDGSFTGAGDGKPGVWTKDVVKGVVESAPVPDAGKLADLLRVAREITIDPREALCAEENPDLVAAV